MIGSFIQRVLALVLFTTVCIQASTLKADMSVNLLCSTEVTISFDEGAPVDTFLIEYRTGSWEISSVTIDLSRSAGKLIFDTTDGGKGIDVFQPFRTVSGNAKINNSNPVSDGGNIMELTFSSFKSGDRYMFSIDVDDQLSQSDLGQTRVTGGEMENAEVILGMKKEGGMNAMLTLVFDGNNQASVTKDTC